MKRQRFFTVTVGVLVLSTGLVLMADRALAAPPTKGGSSATTTQNWDTALPPDQRFTVLAGFNSEAVRDNETGLVWERSPMTITHTWPNACASCAERSIGGRKGWRLPSVHELMSIIDPTQSSPSLSPGHPFLNVQSSLYWSATTSANDPALAWFVGFFSGNLSSPNGKTNTYNLWCVRGGGLLSEY